jgi:hypothetical protein
MFNLAKAYKHFNLYQLSLIEEEGLTEQVSSISMKEI